jgi:hypothetical protein
MELHCVAAWRMIRGNKSEADRSNMSAYDPSDLMALCETILEDGELSGREVYRLSQWLNENREACRHWPGNLLIAPLQNAWADGKLTTAELQEIGRLLVKIHKEWIVDAAESLEPAPPIAPEFFKNIDLSRPLLPLIPWTTRTKSRGGDSTGYEVDLNKPSCTCPDWQRDRSQLPVGHLSRCCRHVLFAYSRVHPPTGWPGWMQAFLGHQWTPHPRKQWMVIDLRHCLVLASTAPVDWADVFAPHEGEYERFGYHMIEDRWAYGNEPIDRDYIRNRIITATRAANDPKIVRRIRFRLPERRATAQPSKGLARG